MRFRLLLGLMLIVGFLWGEDWSFLRSRGRELGKVFNDRWQKRLESTPEWRRFISQPSKRKILERVRERKAGAVDTVKVLVIRVEFQEDTSSYTTGNGRMVLEAQGEPVDSLGERNLAYDPPHDSVYFHHLMESLRNYYWDDSHHTLWIDWTITPFSKDSCYQLPYTMLYYGDPDNWISGMFMLLRDAVEMCDADESANIDFSDYDAIIIFHAGSMWQTDYLWDSPYDLAAAYLQGADEFFGMPVLANNGTDTITDAIIYPETAMQDGVIAFMQGGLAHEFGHQLGLFDLYDTSMETMGAGGWALMGTGNWNMLGLVPPHHSAFSYIRLYGQDRVLEVNGDTTGIELPRLGCEDTLSPLIVKVPINQYEYYLIANRYTYANPDTQHYTTPDAPVDSNGFRVWKDGVFVNVDDWDVSLPPDLYEGGLAIWHIDERVIAEQESLNAVNAVFPHGVDMEEADGVQDFETSFWDVMDWESAFYGNPRDVFYTGSLDSFTPATTPDTRDNSKRHTHIRIVNIRGPDNTELANMRFDVLFDWSIPGFPLTFPSSHLAGFDVGSPVPVDLDGDGVEEILVPSLGGYLYRINTDGGYSVFGEFTDSVYIYGSYSTPAIGDMDGDGDVEVVSACVGGLVYVWDRNGNLLDTFSTGQRIVASPALGDVDGDGADEVFIASDDMRLYGLEWDGDSLALMDGFPVFLGQWTWSTPALKDTFVYVVCGDGVLWKIARSGEAVWRAGNPSVAFTASSPVIADIDRDSVYEVVFSNGKGEVVCVSDSGDVEWSTALKDTVFYSSPAVWDIDGDGFGEIVLPAGAHLYIINHRGAVENNFPVRLDSLGMQSSPVIADIDGDGELDIVVGLVSGGLVGVHTDGSELSGFPIATDTLFSTALVWDVDGDGKLEVFVGDFSGTFHGWEVCGSDVVWGMAYGDVKHSGVVETDDWFQPEQGNSVLIQEECYIYPSPVHTTRATVRYATGVDAESVLIEIYDMAGFCRARWLADGSQGEHDFPVDLSSLASDVYLLRIAARHEGRIYEVVKPFGIAR